MASLFGGNPFASPVGQLVDKATDASLPSENWGLNMEICDVINETEDGPKDGMKAIRKKLSLNVGKNYTVVMYTLTILETCVKNCGKRFHVLVANKDFLQELIKIIGPKNDPPQVVQEKILSLIQTWADAFKSAPDLKEVNKVYMDLKNKGIEFPMTDLDSLAPIHTPARTAPEQEPAPPLPARNPTVIQHTSPQHQSPQHQVAAPTGPVTVSQDQMGKLHHEMEIVQGNVRVFGEMLTELQPNTASTADLELLQELNDTCRQMQQRIVHLLEQVSNEEVTGELLHVNDDLNNIFLRYDRFERYRTGQTGQQEPPSVISTGPPPYQAAAQTPYPPAAAQPPYPPAAQPPYPAAAQPALAPPPVVARNPPSAASEPTTANLIDFGDSPPAQTAAQTEDPMAAANLSDVNVQLASMTVGGSSVSSQLGQLSTTTATNSATNNDDFDMFAQSRQSFDTSKQTLGGNVYANQQGEMYSGGLGAAVNAKSNNKTDTQNKSNEASEMEMKDKEQDLDEMEKWLEENAKNGASQKTKKDEHVTSAEFDSFLASRAAAGDTLPDRRPDGQPARNVNNTRSLKKDETENSLFSL